MILRNEKYAGVWVWNKTRFLKDPDTGRRRPIPRPVEDWIRQDRPELRILEPSLWEGVQARLRAIEETYAHGSDGRLRGRSAAAYSPYLLSGILRCGVCTARMVAATTTRRKNGAVHRYGWYHCAFAVTKGPAVCAHRVGYRRDRLEAALLARFREAMTPARIDALATAVNTRIEAAFRGRDARADAIKTEVLALEAQAGNLVRFLAGGGESPTVREELHAIEAGIQAFRLELGELSRTAAVAPPRVHRTWVLARLAQLEELLAQDPARAKIEIMKHLDGELTISPRPSMAGERRAEVAGRVNANGLLAEQEAVRLSVVAGAGFEPATFGL